MRRHRFSSACNAKRSRAIHGTRPAAALMMATAGATPCLQVSKDMFLATSRYVGAQHMRLRAANVGHAAPRCGQCRIMAAGAGGAQGSLRARRCDRIAGRKSDVSAAAAEAQRLPVQEPSWLVAACGTTVRWDATTGSFVGNCRRQCARWSCADEGWGWSDRRTAQPLERLA